MKHDRNKNPQRQHHPRWWRLMPTTAAVWMTSSRTGGVVAATDTAPHHHNTTNTQCQNDANGAQQDTGCPPDRPLCVDGSGHEPTLGEPGVDCVVCVAFTDDPAQPDWGCSSTQPLCVTTTKVVELSYEQDTPLLQRHRTPNGRAGQDCAPYPCHNTKDFATGQHIDQGCSLDKPFCVDGLGNDPLPGNPGMECVGEGDEHNPEDSAVQHNRGWPHKPTFVARKHSAENSHHRNSWRSVSLCTGCPLSGKGRSCEATKACDSLGGMISSW